MVFFAFFVFLFIFVMPLVLAIIMSIMMLSILYNYSFSLNNSNLWWSLRGAYLNSGVRSADINVYSRCGKADCRNYNYQTDGQIL